MKECIDITAQYFENSIPGRGKIIKEDGYIEQLHQNEISIAKWLIDTFGGDVVLLNEKNLNNVKTPDYLWHREYWDLKEVSSIKAIDNAVRKGLHQIKDNPGGIILDFGNKTFNLIAAKKTLESRLRRGFPTSVDFIIKSKDNRVNVYRYKK